MDTFFLSSIYKRHTQIKNSLTVSKFKHHYLWSIEFLFTLLFESLNLLVITAQEAVKVRGKK